MREGRGERLDCGEKIPAMETISWTVMRMTTYDYRRDGEVPADNEVFPSDMRFFIASLYTLLRCTFTLEIPFRH
jgi:hypothetical protein